MAERTTMDYVIEHGEYLAQAVEAYMTARNNLDAAAESDSNGDAADADYIDYLAAVVAERFRNLRGAIYEFRKRADRAAREQLSASRED